MVLLWPLVDEYATTKPTILLELNKETLAKVQGITWEVILRRFDDMRVSKNRDTPKWMVYNGNPYKDG